jgi:GDPmannose 4,6-dehydratase
MKRALITGITGQDGSYLAEWLLSQGYEVHGVVRRIALEHTSQRMTRLHAILPQLHLHPGSLDNYASLFQIVQKVQPTELYHLGAQSFVAVSFEDPFSTLRTNIDGTLFVLEAVRHVAPQCRVYFAGSSEMFGNAEEVPQRETTRFHPRSPYGVSKVAGFDLTRNYREAYGLFACSGILFNHESPRRGVEFVTRKISRGVAAIVRGEVQTLTLGNLAARRDWGYAGDYVRAMHAMLQQTTPRDYVVATGETHSVQEFCELAFAHAGLDWRTHVRTDPAFQRPAEVDTLIGDAARAQTELGWKPSTDFPGLVRMMVDADLAAGRTPE